MKLRQPRFGESNNVLRNTQRVRSNGESQILALPTKPKAVGLLNFGPFSLLPRASLSHL